MLRPFKLQRVLNLREAELTQTRAALADCLREVAEAEAELAHRRAARRALDVRHQETGERALTPTLLRARLLGARAARHREEAAAAVVGEAQRRLDAQRAVVLKAQRAVRVLERLRERRERQILDHFEAQERRRADDNQGRSGGPRLAWSATLARPQR